MFVQSVTVRLTLILFFTLELGTLANAANDAKDHLNKTEKSDRRRGKRKCENKLIRSCLKFVS